MLPLQCSSSARRPAYPSSTSLQSATHTDRHGRPSSPLRQQLQRIVPVHLFEYVVRKEQSVDAPASLSRRVRRIIEILVGCLQKAIVRSVHLYVREQISAEHDP